MATNSDGGIVLSVNIDSSEVSSDMKKVVSDINKQVQAEAKNIKAVESVNQAKEKTAQQQAKTNKAVYNEVEAEYKALTAEQNLATAKEKSAIVSAKKTVEEEKGYRALVQSEIAENNLQKSSNEVLISEQKLSQEKEKSAQAVTQSEIKQQKLNQEINNSVIAEEKKNKAILDTEKKQQDLLIGEQKLKKSIEDRAIAEEKHKQAIIKTEKAQQSLKKATNSVTTAIKQMATQLGIAFSLKQIINFSKEAGELASQTEAYLTRLGTLYGKTAQDVYDWANANAYALGMSKATAYEAAAQYGNLFTTFASATESAELSIDMLKATAVVASQTGRTYEETFEKMQSGIYGNTRAIDDLGISVRQSSLMQTKAWQKVSKNGTKSWNDLTDAELQQLRVLGIIEQSTAKYGNEVMQTTALTRAQFNAAWTDFKATWGTVVNGVLIPVLNVLTKIITAITTGLTWVAKFMGQTQSISSNINSSASGQSKFNDEIKKTNKNLKKTLAGFDDLQILQSNVSDNTGSEYGDTTPEVPEVMETPTEPSNGAGEVDVSSWQSAIAGLVEILVGVGLVALGIILCSMGQLALGVGAIAFGLFSIGVGLVTLGNAFDTSEAKEMLLIVTGLSGFLLLSIGVLLLCCGAIGWGISCLIGGIALLGFTLYNSKSDEVSSEVEAWINVIFAIVSAALIVIGIILIVTGVGIPLGISLILLGAAGLVTVVAINWDFIKEKIQGVWNSIVNLWNKYIQPGIDKVIGVIKAIWTGCIKPVIDWIVDGIMDLWNNHIKPLWTDHLQPAIAEIGAKLNEFWEKVILPVLQAIANGAIWLWEHGIKPVIDWIGDAALWLWNKVLLPFANFVKEFFVNVFKNAFGSIKGYFEILLDTAGGIIDGLKNTFSGFITFLIGIFTGNLGKAFDGIKQSFGGMIESVKSIFNGILATIINAINGFINGLNLMIGVINKIPNVDIPLIPNIKMPKLAQGAVIPANHEFLAVLGDQKHGTNIEAPAELIKQMAKEAYQEMGLTGGQQQQIVKEEHYYLNQTELMKLMYKLAKGGERLNGTSLVKQGGM